MDLLPERFKKRGVFPIGRLDKDSEGLLLFTTDGELSNKISSPKSKIEKTYTVLLNHPLKEHDGPRMLKGIFVKELKMVTRFESIQSLSLDQLRWRVVLKEGKKRQIRYLFLALGYRVKSLERISYGPLNLQGTPRGMTRKLKESEISRLKKTLLQ
jgi:pseudouridine synthase